MGNANSKDMCMWKNVKRSFLFDQQFWRRQIIINSFIDQFLLVPEIFETFHCVAWEKKLLFWAQSSCPSCDCSDWPLCRAPWSGCWTDLSSSSRTCSGTSSLSRPFHPLPPCCHRTWRRRSSGHVCGQTASFWTFVHNITSKFLLKLHSSDLLMNIERFCFEAKTVSRRKHIPHKSPLFQYLYLQNGMEIIYIFSLFLLKLLHFYCL